MKKFFLLIVCFAYFSFLLGEVNAQTLAFPGAEGHGRFATGGRGGKIVRVTKLDDNASGEPLIEGSLRWALDQASPKIILFDVSGTIHLKQQMKTRKDNITFAGHSAPGDGICVAGHEFVINTNNIIIRFMRFRPGDESSSELDGLGGMDKKNIIIDHCSTSWSTDECLSVYGMENMTVQWCIASEALRMSVHSKSAHCYGGNWGGNKASYHHNLIAHCESRTPRLGPRAGTQRNEYVDIRNNVFYNWAGEGCYGGEGMKVNMVNNYYKPGPATAQASSAVKYRIAKIGIRTQSYVKSYPAFAPMLHVWGKFYIDGNKIEGNEEVTNDNWTKGVYAQQSNGGSVDNLWTQETMDTIRLREPLEVGYVTTHTADLAYQRVLDYVGCCLVRDEVDERVISDARQGIATFTASGNKPGYINSQNDTKPAGATSDWSPFPTLNSTELPLDSDGDGIPDEWEDANGLDKYNSSDGNERNEEGYTYLEVYLNSLVQHIIDAQNADGEVIDQIDEEYIRPEVKSVVYASGNTVYLKNLSGNSLIEIYGLNGNCIMKRNCFETETDLQLNTGIYIIRVVSEQKAESFKVKVL